jgi:probable rRNA maturation factor
LIEIQIYNESGINLPLEESRYLKIAQIISEGEKVPFGFLEIVYVDEDEIIRVNQEYLGKSYVTDIITFTYDDEIADNPSSKDDSKVTDGTIFMCAPRIVEQASEYGETIGREFSRIFIHGLLHLSGYDDHTGELKAIMAEKENFYLEKLSLSL